MDFSDVDARVAKLKAEMASFGIGSGRHDVLRSLESCEHRMTALEANSDRRLRELREESETRIRQAEREIALQELEMQEVRAQRVREETDVARLAAAAAAAAVEEKLQQHFSVPRSRPDPSPFVAAAVEQHFSVPRDPAPFVAPVHPLPVQGYPVFPVFPPPPPPPPPLHAGLPATPVPLVPVEQRPSVSPTRQRVPGQPRDPILEAAVNNRVQELLTRARLKMTCGIDLPRTAPVTGADPLVCASPPGGRTPVSPTRLARPLSAVIPQRPLDVVLKDYRAGEGLLEVKRREREKLEEKEEEEVTTGSLQSTQPSTHPVGTQGGEPSEATSTARSGASPSPAATTTTTTTAAAAATAPSASASLSAPASAPVAAQTAASLSKSSAPASAPISAPVSAPVANSGSAGGSLQSRLAAFRSGREELQTTQQALLRKEQEDLKKVVESELQDGSAWGDTGQDDLPMLNVQEATVVRQDPADPGLVGRTSSVSPADSSPRPDEFNDDEDEGGNRPSVPAAANTPATSKSKTSAPDNASQSPSAPPSLPRTSSKLSQQSSHKSSYKV